MARVIVAGRGIKICGDLEVSRRTGTFLYRQHEKTRTVASSLVQWSRIEQTIYLFGHMFAKRTLNPDIVPSPKYILHRRSKGIYSGPENMPFTVIMVAIERSILQLSAEF